MADEADISQARMEQEEAMRERNRQPYYIPAGVAGACAPCRDKHGLA